MAEDPTVDRLLRSGGHHDIFFETEFGGAVAAPRIGGGETSYCPQTHSLISCHGKLLDRRVWYGLARGMRPTGCLMILYAEDSRKSGQNRFADSHYERVSLLD